MMALPCPDETSRSINPLVAGSAGSEQLPLRKLFKTIKVGPEKQEFSVHKEILCHHSPFFKGALEGGFQEAKTQVVELPEQNPYAFEYFVQWLYTRELFQGTEKMYLTFYQLYVLADLLQIPALQNDIVDEFLAQCVGRRTVPAHYTQYLYQTVPEGPLRELVLDLFTWRNTKEVLKKKDCGYHNDFLQDLVVRMKEKELGITGCAPWLQDPCKYHKHTEKNKMGCKKRKHVDDNEPPSAVKAKKVESS